MCDGSRLSLQLSHSGDASQLHTDTRGEENTTNPAEFAADVRRFDLRLATATAVAGRLITLADMVALVMLPSTGWSARIWARRPARRGAVEERLAVSTAPLPPGYDDGREQHRLSPHPSGRLGAIG